MWKMILKISNWIQKQSRSLCSTAIISIPCLLIVVNVSGEEIQGVFFDDIQKVGNREFVLRGLGLMRYMVFFKVSVAGLYMPGDIPSKQVLFDVPKRLEIQYLQAITANDFMKMTNTWLEKNVTPETIEQLRPRIAQFNSLYEDVTPKDRYCLTYLPGKGTELALNGNTKGRIEGADFASALFSIWLGPVPVSKSAKAGLLGDWRPK